jgi:hypothetical protein
MHSSFCRCFDFPCTLSTPEEAYLLVSAESQIVDATRSIMNARSTTTATLLTQSGGNGSMNPVNLNEANNRWPGIVNTLSSESTWKSRLSQSSPATPQWREPERSIGLPCCALGKHKCWEVVGPAQDISQTIFRATKDLLDQHSEFLHETESVPFSIMFGLYMVGKNEKKASPTLILSCAPKKPRQKAVKLIHESGILRHYPGVLLAESSQSPTTLGQVRPLGRLNAADKDFIYFTPPSTNNVCGRSIHIMGADPQNLAFLSISQKATLGGFVRLQNAEHNELYCGLTVAHAFEDEPEAPPVSSDIEFAFYGQDDDDDTDSDSEPDLGQRKWSSLLPKFVSRVLLILDTADPPSVSQLAEQISKLCNTIEVPNEDQTYISMTRQSQGRFGN